MAKAKNKAAPDFGLKEIMQAAEELIEIDLRLNSSPEPIGKIFLRQPSASDVMSLGQDGTSDEQRERYDAFLVKLACTRDKSPLFASDDQVRQVPFPVYRAMQDAINDYLGVEVEQQGNALSGTAG